jgi:hypothetical protein
MIGDMNREPCGRSEEGIPLLAVVWLIQAGQDAAGRHGWRRL